MTRFKGRYRTESDRWPGWDYTSRAWYFITICTKEHDLHFGLIREDSVGLSPLGKIARKHWVHISQRVQNAHVDEFVIMPNHLHGILAITSLGNNHSDRESSLPAESTVETLHATSLRVNSNAILISKRMSRISPKTGSLGAIIRSYKSSVTRWARRNDYPHFTWQRGYYDRIIRSEKELRNIRKYIQNNPLQWSLDQYHKSE